MREREMMGVEFDVSRFESEERVVFAYSDVLAGVEFGAALTDEDLSWEDVLVWM